MPALARGHRVRFPRNGRNPFGLETRVNLLGVLENGLFALGQVLRFPVMVLLWVCVLGRPVPGGGCVVEFVVRRRERRGFNLTSWLKGGPVSAPKTRGGGCCRPRCGSCSRISSGRGRPRFAGQAGSSTWCWPARSSSRQR